MALETAAYLADLNALNPATTDTMAQGDDHIRLLKKTLLATFPNFTSGALNSSQAQLDGLVALLSGNTFSVPAGTSGTHNGAVLTLKGQAPDRDFRVQNSNGNLWVQSWDGAAWVNAFVVDQAGNFYVGPDNTKISFVGEIRIFNGQAAQIPAGWALCNGANGTPDLRDRFIVGAGGSYNPGATGGANAIALTTAQLPAHNHPYYDPGHVHAITVHDPGHTHGVYDPGHAHGMQMGGQAGSGFAAMSNGNASTQFTGPASTNISLYASGTGVTATSDTRYTGLQIQNTGSGQAHENRPPYYALCYIMRIK